MVGVTDLKCGGHEFKSHIGRAYIFFNSLFVIVANFVQACKVHILFQYNYLKCIFFTFVFIIHGYLVAGRMNERTNERTDEGTNERTNERMNEQVHESIRN